MNLLKFLLAQFLGWLLVSKLGHLTSGLALADWQLALLQGGSAGSISLLFRQAWWWLPINLLFSLAVLFTLTEALPPWIYLAVFSVLLLLFWGTIKGDVPLFLSSNAVAEAVADHLTKHPARRLAELGAGIGSVAVPLARQFPALPLDAYEHAPLPWLLLTWHGLGLSSLQTLRTNFWQVDLAQYDVVFAFLSPRAMPQLAEKAQREMRPGTLLISSSFPIHDWQASRIQELSDARRTKLFYYYLGKHLA